MIVISLIYLVLLGFVLDTIRRHDLFNRQNPKGFNLYLFYFMAIMVCLLRIMVMMCVFSSIIRDDYKPFDYFNYGFYSATLAIILIAFSQINSIITAALRTRYVNKHIEGLQPAIENLNRMILINHIVNIVIDIANLTYFTYQVIRLFRYYNYEV